ncbi:MAG: hypothetical protein CK424_05785 [Legionella sp.]|nr:MAG: hypothetical protein CK424_05785 [Legionella sp.]
MIIRRANERGRTQTAWLDSYHAFSFAEYHDPLWMSFGPLRVINDDVIAPNGGFSMHSHRDMDIMTYVISGELAHKDNMGNGTLIRPGEIQRMSAGTGVKHSEFNASATTPLHLLQIWIEPQTLGLPPGYEQKEIKKRENEWVLIGSDQEHADAVLVHQRLNLYVAYLNTSHILKHTMQKPRGWIQVIKGQITINDILFSQGDAVGFLDETEILITGIQDSELLLFEMGNK